jgi:hypothetical protein
MFASTSAKDDRGDTKDSANIRETGGTHKISEYAMRDAMNRSSGAWSRDVDEFVDVGSRRLLAARLIAPMLPQHQQFWNAG